MADFFKWDENTLGLKVKQMDDEHQVLIRLMNELHDGYAAKKSFPELKNKLIALSDFTIKHFSDEEKYMESIKFPGLATHKLIHKDLLDSLKKYGDEFIKTQVLSEEFFRFLTVWLTSHIKGIDRKYANHAHGKTAA